MVFNQIEFCGYRPNPVLHDTRRPLFMVLTPPVEDTQCASSGKLVAMSSEDEVEELPRVLEAIQTGDTDGLKQLVQTEDMTLTDEVTLCLCKLSTW